MLRTSKQARLICLTLIFCLALPSLQSLACVIPVFRYALERWQADRYELLVFHDRELTEEEKKPLQGLIDGSVERARGVNVQLRFVHLRDSDDRELINFWETNAPSKKAEGEPFVFLRAPLKTAESQTLWSGTLSQFLSKEQLQSPTRKELTDRLLTGDSVVWLLAKSNDDATNQELKRTLQSQLEELATKMELPGGIGEPGSELYSKIPLKVQFTVLEFDPADQNEKAFYNQMMKALGKPEYTEEGHEAVLVPVFGRGRALEAIPASKATEKVVENVTKFLCGACSCQVKELNPGTDLLLNVDWDGRLFGEAGAPPEIRLQNRPSGTLRPEIIPIPSGRKSKR